MGVLPHTHPPTQFCPRGFGVHPSISSVAPSKDPTSSPLLREVGEDQSPLLQRQFVLLLPRLLQQLPPHNSENRAQQRPPEHLGRLVPRQAVAELGHVAVTQPPARRRHSISTREPRHEEHTRRYLTPSPSAGDEACRHAREAPSVGQMLALPARAPGPNSTRVTPVCSML